jgi:hypothetical protein
MSENLRTNQAFEPGLFELRKFRITAGQREVISTTYLNCSRIDIDVMNGTLHGFWGMSHGGSELPDFQLSNGHRTYEFHPRPVTLTLYAGGSETLFVSVLLTNPIEAKGGPVETKEGCGCG